LGTDRALYYNMLYSALVAACVACTMAYPKYLECGSDQTSKLRAGQTIMGQIVIKDSGDGAVKITADHDTVTVTSSSPERHFALKAWGDGAELKSCSSGLTQTKEGGLFGQKCASQFYMNDYLPNVPSFTCKHTGASGFAVVYAKGSVGGVLLATQGPQPTDAIQLSSNLTENVGHSTWNSTFDSTRECGKGIIPTPWLCGNGTCPPQHECSSFFCGCVYVGNNTIV